MTNITVLFSSILTDNRYPDESELKNADQSRHASY